MNFLTAPRSQFFFFIIKKNMVKTKYKIGTCFGCQKCLYCGIDLEKLTCKCRKTIKPTKKNRTDLVKNAYLRVFDPTSSIFNQVNFMKNRNEHFQYGYDLTKSFHLSFCSTCNSLYQRLKNSGISNDSSNSIDISNNTYLTDVSEFTGSIDVEAATEVMSNATTTKEDKNTLYNSFSEPETEDEELEINYKLVIKQVDGTFLPAKNYSVTISELDEFLLTIQNNVIVLTRDETIDANDYDISFKSEKAQGAGTLLADTNDFKFFRSEYIKLVATKRIMLIMIIMKKKEKLIKRKKKVIY